MGPVRVMYIRGEGGGGGGGGVGILVVRLECFAPFEQVPQGGLFNRSSLQSVNGLASTSSPPQVKSVGGTELRFKSPEKDGERYG